MMITKREKAISRAKKAKAGAVLATAGKQYILKKGNFIRKELRFSINFGLSFVMMTGRFVSKSKQLLLRFLSETARRYQIKIVLTSLYKRVLWI